MAETRLHILDVGRGDCVIVELPSGRLAMIDVSDRGMTDPVEYFKTHFPGRSLFLFVLTHPHRNRLSGLKRVKEEIGFTHFWDINHQYEPDTSSPYWESDSFREDWQEYLKIRSGGYPEIKVANMTRGNEHDYLKNDGIQVLSPSKELQNEAITTGDYHLSSYALSLKCDQNQAILGGSANQKSWADIYRYFGPQSLRSNLLLASHHGNRGGFHKEAIKAIKPAFTIISVEKESYSDAARLYSHYSSSGVISTATNGNIVVTCHPHGGVGIKTQY
jgi:beta-lactamase superfamily II metal-dependent hydrolase